MWIPARLLDWLHVSKDTVSALREDLASVRTERDSLKQQVLVAQNNFDWVKQRVFQLEVERGQLLERAYGIKTVVPEVVRKSAVEPLRIDANLFEDVGEDVARELGLPAYGVK